MRRPSERYWESTRLYLPTDDGGQQIGTGNQDWCRQLITTAVFSEIRSANIGRSDRPAFAGRIQSGEGIAVRFLLEAGNAFLGGTPPKLDADFAIFLRQANGGEPEFKIYGRHDGFPAYEIYLDQKLVYCHDPISSGNTPWSLFGGLGFGGVTADTGEWKKVEEISCTSIKGIQVNSPIGGQGSKFALTGNGFKSSNLSSDFRGVTTSTVDIYINNVLLGDIDPDKDGKFQLTLDTSSASFGIYEVIVIDNATNNTFNAEFQLQPDFFVIPELDGVEKSFFVPPGIARIPVFIYLPSIQR